MNCLKYILLCEQVSLSHCCRSKKQKYVAFIYENKKIYDIVDPKIHYVLIVCFSGHLQQRLLSNCKEMNCLKYILLCEQVSLSHCCRSKKQKYVAFIYENKKIYDIVDPKIHYVLIVCFSGHLQQRLLSNCKEMNCLRYFLLCEQVSLAVNLIWIFLPLFLACIPCTSRE